MKRAFAAVVVLGILASTAGHASNSIARRVGPSCVASGSASAPKNSELLVESTCYLYWVGPADAIPPAKKARVTGLSVAVIKPNGLSERLTTDGFVRVALYWGNHLPSLVKCIDTNKAVNACTNGTAVRSAPPRGALLACHLVAKADAAIRLTALGVCEVGVA